MVMAVYKNTPSQEINLKRSHGDEAMESDVIKCSYGTHGNFRNLFIFM